MSVASKLYNISIPRNQYIFPHNQRLLHRSQSIGIHYIESFDPPQTTNHKDEIPRPRPHGPLLYPSARRC